MSEGEPPNKGGGEGVDFVANLIVLKSKGIDVILGID
jgi:hypothetical protein